ncbi:hypothetical protein [Gynuella sp.]|uniref:hypothetical protein n=1 Tax=Gynuella sp. TaxID=2969146 RepID=UPI003D0B8049
MIYKKRRKYKYILQGPVAIQVAVHVPKPVAIGPLTISPTGGLQIDAGYAWDGATLCPDVQSIIFPSLVHDAMYQLIREGVLNIHTDRKIADKLLKELCIQSGMWKPAAWLVYHAVRLFGRKAAENDLLSVPG